MRKFLGDELIIATHNRGKLVEIQKLLGAYVKRFSTAGDHELSEPDEIGGTFHENAELKARAATNATGIPALADDSGLCVEALGGAPGIYSARWVQNKNYQTAMDRIFNELAGQSPRAKFICVLALAWPDREIVFAEGECAGTLVLTPRGEEGFGYDPYFIPDGYEKTFAELGHAVKEKISHRAHAFQNLIANYF